MMDSDGFGKTSLRANFFRENLNTRTFLPSKYYLLYELQIKFFLNKFILQQYFIDFVFSDPLIHVMQTWGWIVLNFKLELGKFETDPT